MPTLYIMVGVAFSGKSTLSRKIAEYTNATLVSQDALWFEKEKELKLEDNSNNWKIIMALCEERMRSELSKGKSVVYDNTSLQFNERENLRNLAKSTNATAKVVYLDTPEEIQEKRWAENLLSNNRHNVEQKWIDKARTDLEIPQATEAPFIYTPDADIEDFLVRLTT